MLPDFIVGGIMKSGTTYLDTFLRNHPEIRMPLRSMDYSFFDNDKIYRKGIKWYESLFEGVEKGKVIGQTSADCAFNPGSMERLRLHMPHCKLIFVIRHPVDRVYSHYWHARKMGREYKAFRPAIYKEKSRTRWSYYAFKKFSYVGKSRYKSQFEEVFRHFPAEQVLIIPFESLIKHEVAVLNYVFDFLGVQQIESPRDLLTEEDIKTNAARIPTSEFISLVSYVLQKVGLVRAARVLLNKNLVEKRPPAMPEDVKKYLTEALKDDIAFYKEEAEKFNSKLGLKS